MSKETSTAALDSFRLGSLRNLRRVPHHPAGEYREGMASAMPRRSRKMWALATEVLQSQINKTRQKIQQAQLAIYQEDAMNSDAIREARRKSLYNVSNESLAGYLAYTRVMIGLLNRLDLFKQYRVHRSGVLSGFLSTPSQTLRKCHSESRC